jgi:hypothetical protein
MSHDSPLTDPITAYMTMNSVSRMAEIGLVETNAGVGTIVNQFWMDNGGDCFLNYNVAGTPGISKLRVGKYNLFNTVTLTGSANQVIGNNAGNTASEFKTIAAGTGISVTHGVGSITIAVTGVNGGTA